MHWEKLPFASFWPVWAAKKGQPYFTFFNTSVSLIGKQFHLGAINTETCRLGSWCTPCSAVVISLGLPTIGSPAGFHYTHNQWKNKQGEMNETFREKEKPKGITKNVCSPVFTITWTVFYQKISKVDFWSWVCCLKYLLLLRCICICIYLLIWENTHEYVDIFR